MITADKLYLFTVGHRPCFFFDWACEWLPEMPLPVHDTADLGWPLEGKEVHDQLHEWLEIPCCHRPNMTPRRNGGDTEFSALVRQGCRSTPFMDVDEIVTQTTNGPEMLVALIEHKRAGDSVTNYQDAVICQWNWQFDIPYRIEDHRHREVDQLRFEM